MGIRENIAASIQTVMKHPQKSLTEFSEELGISRNALYGYIRGRKIPALPRWSGSRRNWTSSPPPCCLASLRRTSGGLLCCCWIPPGRIRTAQGEPPAVCGVV